MEEWSAVLIALEQIDAYRMEIKLGRSPYQVGWGPCATGLKSNCPAQFTLPMHFAAQRTSGVRSRPTGKRTLALYGSKAVGEPNLHEFSITLALSKLFPQSVAKMIAARPDWNG